MKKAAARRVAVVGAKGQLGRVLVSAFEEVGDHVVALAKPAFDMTNYSHMRNIAGFSPDVVVNAAAWTDVDACARDPSRAMEVNGDAAGEVARAAGSVGALAVQVSTNEVFDGMGKSPYTESDRPNPTNAYGASKLAGEYAVATTTSKHLITRTAWLYGQGDRNFPGKIRAAAERAQAEGRPLRVVADEWGNPTDVRWLASAIRRLVDLTLSGDAAPGIYHLAGQPPTSRYGWAKVILDDADVVLEPTPLKEFRRDSRVPPAAILDTQRAAGLGIDPHDWRSHHGG